MYNSANNEPFSSIEDEVNSIKEQFGPHFKDLEKINSEELSARFSVFLSSDYNSSSSISLTLIFKLKPHFSLFSHLP